MLMPITIQIDQNGLIAQLDFGPVAKTQGVRTAGHAYAQRVKEVRKNLVLSEAIPI